MVGSIETLAEKGIVNEVAGTGLKMFFLRLQTGADETNPKIVGLQTALKNLQKLSTEEIVKRFGAETYTVAQTLIDGADKVEYYTKAVTGTNVAMEQGKIDPDNDSNNNLHRDLLEEVAEVFECTGEKSPHIKEYLDVEEELADVIIVALSTLHHFKCDIDSLIEAKMNYNKNRMD